MLKFCERQPHTHIRRRGQTNQKQYALDHIVSGEQKCALCLFEYPNYTQKSFNPWQLDCLSGQDS